MIVRERERDLNSRKYEGGVKWVFRLKIGILRPVQAVFRLKRPNFVSKRPKKAYRKTN